LLTFELDLRKISAPVGLLWKQTLQAKNSGFDFATITVNGDIVYDSSGIPDESGWTLHYASLDDYAGNRVTLVFNFFATGVVNDEGWYIDDLTIEHCNEPTSNILKVLYYPILTGVTSE
jgi:bacillopeptidase F (M6 metalloprotease family)